MASAASSASRTRGRTAAVGEEDELAHEEHRRLMPAARVDGTRRVPGHHQDVCRNLGVAGDLPKEASVTTIGKAVRRVLDDTRFRQAAQRFVAEDPQQLTVDELESLIGRQAL